MMLVQLHPRQIGSQKQQYRLRQRRHHHLEQTEKLIRQHLQHILDQKFLTHLLWYYQIERRRRRQTHRYFHYHHHHRRRRNLLHRLMYHYHQLRQLHH